MKVSNWLTAAAAAHPERIALISETGELTYMELEQRANRASRRLAGLGVREGDRVASTLTGGELVVLMHGALKLGAAIAPLDPRLAPRELDAILSGLDARVVLSDQEMLEQAPEASEAPSPMIDLESVLCVIHTSGSGGRPKPVELTCANHLWSTIGCATRIDMRPTDRWLCCLPTHHIGGFAIAVRCAIYAATVVLEPFDTRGTAARLASGDIEIVSLVATMLDRLLDAGADVDGLRCALLGGGPASESLIDRALEAGIPIAPTYGMTETCSQVTTLLPRELPERHGSAGLPIAPARVRIDEDGRIAVAGPILARSAADENGWLRTGDLGRLDENGYLYVLGRADGVIVSGGENVSPEEVEAVLVQHAAIADAAVFGREDPRWQNAVVAAVVKRQGASVDSDALREFCRARLSGSKVPKQIEFVSELPRNEQGKLARRELR